MIRSAGGLRSRNRRMDTVAHTVRVLLLEDMATDAERIECALRCDGIDFTSQRVETKGALVAALEAFKPDVLLADFPLPGFDDRTAVELVRRAHPEIPVVMVTGTLGEEAAIELLKAGAKDYVLKSNLVRLGAAVRRALAEEQGVRARKSAERALRDSEEKYRALVEQNVAGIVIIRNDGRVGYVNPYFCTLIGYAAAEVIGRPLLDFVPESEKPNVREKLWGQLAGAGGLVQLATVMEKQGGGTVDILVNATRATYEGAPASIAVVLDITERRKAEEALRASRDLLARTERIAGVGGWEWDTVRDALVWSDEVYRMFGRAPGDFALSVPGFIASVHLDDRRRVEDAIAATLTQDAPFELEFRIVRPDRTERIIHTRGELVRARDGTPVRMTGTSHDITE
jgi:PAS domain S-box-containing protein